MSQVDVMSVEPFVDKKSVVRRIWGQADTILFIFAGASAEFALNKAVDWLYFTGRLPQDPLGRLFSTVSYARAIIFSGKQAACRAIDSMSKIHADVEDKRGARIPDWAYRDVLFMLIDYSIRSFEVLERKMRKSEKEEVFNVFLRVGKRMGLEGLPRTWAEFKWMRLEHLKEDLCYSNYTDNLFAQYRKHLGFLRYRILLQVQALVVPQRVRDLLGLDNTAIIRMLVRVYKWTRIFRLDWILKELVLPSAYKKQIRQLDSVPAG